MSTNSDRSKPAAITRLLREAAGAEAAGRLSEATALLQEVARLDPRDPRTLHRLGEIHRTRLNRPDRAASWYACEARCYERDGAASRAIAAWRLVVRCIPDRLEAHERIGALYTELGRIADARLHYESSARDLHARGLPSEAAILRAQLAAMEPAESPAGAPGPEGAAAADAGVQLPSDAVPDADALSLAAEREQYARVYFHHGLNAEARRQLEDLLAILPDHVGARQLLVEVCRALDDQPAAAEHLRVLTKLLRRESGPGATARAADQGHAEADDPCELPPFEEWGIAEAADVTADVEVTIDSDVSADLLDAVRNELERFVEGIAGRPGGSGSTGGRQGGN